MENPPLEDASEVEADANKDLDIADGGTVIDEPECLSDEDCSGKDVVCVDGTCQRCGPSHAYVQYVYDGDTVILADGERIRFLLVNTPEIANAYTGEPAECYGDEALVLTKSILNHRTIDLEYDLECRDHYNRLLAWISIDGLDVNAHLVEQGAAKVMLVPPNGYSRYQQYKALERSARENGIGQWGACD